MIVKCLVENTAVSEAFKAEHGLSLYIKTDDHNILFDVGYSDLFIENAKTLDIDLTQVDIVVISHGHKDHGGGLKAFLEINKNAVIYMHKQAFDLHYSNRDSGMVDISIDQSLKLNDRLILTDDSYKIDEHLFLFAGVKGMLYMPDGNKHLMMKQNDVIVEDDFAHEQNLMINDKSQNILIAGCAHRGIVNILNQAQQLEASIDTIIGGFHLNSRRVEENEPIEKLENLANYLKATQKMFYTCHCTGDYAFDILKRVMNDQVDYIRTGQVIDL